MDILSVESIYQSRLECFQSAAQAGAAKLGGFPGVFAELLEAIDSKMGRPGSTQTVESEGAISSRAYSGLNGLNGLGILGILGGLDGLGSPYRSRSQYGGYFGYANLLSNRSSTRAEIESAVRRASWATGLDENLIRAVIQTESSFRPDAVSSAGAMGLMQLMPGTAREMGVIDPFDPNQSVMGGAGYLKKLVDRFGDMRLALAAYNTGQGRISALGIENPDDEDQYNRISAGVRGYVDKVLNNWDKFRNG